MAAKKVSDVELIVLAVSLTEVFSHIGSSIILTKTKKVLISAVF